MTTSKQQKATHRHGLLNLGNRIGSQLRLLSGVRKDCRPVLPYPRVLLGTDRDSAVLPMPRRDRWVVTIEKTLEQVRIAHHLFNTRAPKCTACRSEAMTSFTRVHIPVDQNSAEQPLHGEYHLSTRPRTTAQHNLSYHILPVRLKIQLLW